MTAAPNVAIELAFIDTFVVRQKRARYSGLVVSPRLRPKFLYALRSFGDFDPRLKVRLSVREDSSRGHIEELRRRGAGPTCYLISTWAQLDGATMPLEAAITEVHALRDGTAVICPSTHLAYYEGEMGYRFILDSKGLKGAR
jgi:hypothetical protein